MNEPRIHFAIVCASIGCPRLMNEAYMPNTLDQQLVTNTKDFFSHSQNLQVDTNAKTIKLSKIMEWYGTDFGADVGTQIRTLEKYFPQLLNKQSTAVDTEQQATCHMTGT